MRVRCVGHPPRITAWIQGVVAVDYRAEETEGFAQDGLIGLQVHGARGDPPGSKVMFKNIQVRRVPSAPTR